ncbi:protein TASOR-like [Xiphophorus maculatus]|uniref:Protein TASOR-like n=1 Tax=Xiphophorus maculatus TaxID=8083 RepID=A0A3B5R3M7_XIPMA|nr:protein TASOR-like [Xiphophorus maculatus]
MEDGFSRREACPVRRVSAAADFSYRDCELLCSTPGRGGYPAAARLSPAAAGKIVERRKSAPQVVHQRHMPSEPKKFHIPRKTKEKKALFQFVSTESREYEDMKTILTSGYIDSNSSGCFTYSNPQLVHSELLEKEFVEKRREMKADGRTDKELEESYCFLMTNSVKLPVLCEKGLTVGRSKNTVLGNPSKGVYLSRFSDLLQTRPLTPGTTGELLILKVMKGKVKSIYENMKILQDPTPRFDSHIAKNASKVTSLSCFRAYELTQQYFYEYLFDELRERPRQVCPYAVVSFHFKGKDAPLSVKPAAPVRSSSQFSESSKGCAQFTVWTGDLVKNERVLLQVSLQSSSTPSLPLRLPEKLDIDSVVTLDEVTNLVPSAVFSFNTYRSSKEVVIDGYYCSLLEVIDRNQSSTNVTMLLRELETKQLVLVNPLTDKGFLFLLSSVQMATPTERGENWKKSLQALFVFLEPRDVSTFPSRCSSSQDSLPSSASPMPRLSDFLPALHHSLVKTRANPPANLSAGVELQTREYLSGVTAGSVQPCPMTEYDSVLDEETKPCPPYQRPNTDSYLRSYLANPAAYMLSAARARQAVEALLGPEPPPEKTPRNNRGPTDVAGHNAHKVQQLLDQILTCKKNAEAEVRREDGDGLKASKRKMDQKTAERALKYFKASLETGKADRIPVGGNKTSVTSIITSLGLKDVDLREDRSEVTVKFLRQLKGLVNAANQSPSEAIEDGLKESSPFGRLAMKLGLPTNCDIDLRKQEELEEQTAGSVSSLEGFSPGSHSGEPNYHGGRGGGRLGRKAPANEEQEEEWEIPWVLIPITGLSSERYSQRDRSLPQDPRFQHRDLATGVTVTTKLPRRSPAPSPERSPPPSYLSPEATPPPSPFQCSSPIPSPPPSPSQCPSPDPSPSPSPSQCPSPDPSPPSSPLTCPSPLPSPRPSPARSPSPETKPPPSQRCLPANEVKPPNELQVSPKEFPGESSKTELKVQQKEVKTEPASVPAEMDPFSVLPWRIRSSPSKSQRMEESEGEAETLVKVKVAAEEEEEVHLEEGYEEVAERNQSEPKEPDGGLFGHPVRDLDSVVDKNLMEFSSDLHLLLQDEGVNYSLPPLPPAPLPPYALLPQFSPYVSFYNPCPPVADYVGSLHNSIVSLLAASEDRGALAAASEDRGAPAAAVGIPVDAALANTVSDFVASVRAGKTSAGRTAATEQFSDCDPTSGSGSAWGRAAQPQHGAAVRTVLCSPAEEGGETLTGADRTITMSELGSGSETQHPQVASPNPASASVLEPGAAPVPSTTHISSVIDRLEPNVLHNLAEILKDIKRKTPQFYVHCPEPDDPVCKEVKEYLVSLGNVHQSPADFLHQDNTENGLLVIIKNQDIAGHVHRIPGLMSLKRHSSVVFVGIDSLDDIKNSSCIELFVSGGCIVSDELVLNPDVIPHSRLAALLMLLEKHSSPESLWRWKIHCKTHKKLKEQARFRRDAANLLDLLSAYQKRQIVEFLPYHHCDMTNHQSPDLDCLTELQARYTQFRHTVYLTEHSFDKFPVYSNGGIIVAAMEEIERSFSRLVGCLSVKDKQLFLEDLLAPKGLGQQSPSTAADRLHPVADSNQTPGVLTAWPRAPDQLAPDAGSERVSVTTSRDMEVLQQAIKEMRAERLKQLQQLRMQQQLLELQVESSDAALPAAAVEGGHLTPPTDRAAPPESVRFTPGRKAVTATLDLIHSGLQLETWEGERSEDRGRPTPTEGHSAQNRPELSNQSAAARSADPNGPDFDQEPDRRQEPDRSSGSPEEGDVSRSSQSNQQPPVGAEAAHQSSAESRIPVLMYRDQNQPGPALFGQPPQRSVGLLQAPQLPQFHGQHFHTGPLLGALRPLGALRGIMGPPPIWPGGLAPTASPLVWGLQQPGVDLLGGFYGPAGPGGSAYRGARPGGGFNRM